jgi:undecaprenyl-diphosphatase
MKLDSYRTWFIILLLLLTIFRLGYIQWGPLDLAPDEAHYWDWSRRPALSYYSKGPMVAYIIWLFTHLGEHTSFWVRLGAVVISLFFGLVTYLFAYRMFADERIAFFSFLTFQIIPLYAAGGVLMTIDPPMVFFWALAIYFFYLALEGSAGWWYLSGVALGLGLLSKYTMAFLIPLLFLYLALSPRYRHLLKTRQPYLWVLIGGVFFLPVLIWNHQHNWVSFRHLSGQISGHQKGFSLKTFFEFLGSQLGVISPFLFGGLVYGMAKSAVYGLREKREDFLLLFCTSAPVLLIYLGRSLWGKAQANWAAPAYFTAVIATVAIFYKDYIALNLWSKKPWLRRYVGLCVVFALLLTVVAHNDSLLNFMGIHLPPKRNPTTRLKGWRQLGAEVSRIREQMGEKTFILSNRYQITSELAFYVAGQPRTYCLNTGRRQNQYDYWEGPEALKGYNAIYVRKGKRNIKKQVAQAFETCQPEPLFSVYENDTKVKSFSIFRCYGFSGFKPPEEEVTY